jgi:hypothetical protein
MVRMEAIAIAMGGASRSSLGIRGQRRARVLAGEIIRITLASVLMFSGLTKLRAPYEFLASVYGYEMTGPLVSLVIATVLPWLELLTALCLWGKCLYRGALATAILLTAVFCTVIGIAMYRQLDISCGCFLAGDKISYLTLIRSAVLFAASIIGLVLAIREHNPTRVALARPERRAIDE